VECFRTETTADDRGQAGIRQLRARVATLEQLLEVYERSVVEQSEKLYAERERLRFQTTLLRSQGEASIEGVLSASVDGRILFANRRLSEMWGVEPPGVGSRCFRETIESMAERCSDPNRFLVGARAITSDQESSTEIALADGRTLDCYTAPIRSDDGALLGRVWQFRDISAVKEVNRLKDEFIAAVSHELRTPLTSIRGSLDLMVSGVTGQLADEAMSLAKVAQHNCRRLGRLIDDVLDIEKIEAGRMDFRLEPSGLESLLEESVQAMRPYGEERRVRFAIASSAPGARVRVDRDRLIQVMENLLSNAAKFSPAGETVRVSLERDGPRLRVAVMDRGPGIAREFETRIFEKFAQIETRGTRKQEGTGLGLNIARAIVAHHGGNIWYSPNPGGGSIFSFDLPEWRP
jgi:signal transduction histidine kinase